MSNLAPKLVNANLDVIEAEVLTQLPADLQKIAIAASNALGKTAEAVFDGVKPDGPQLEAIWREYINQHLIDYAAGKAIVEAGKIKSPILKTLTLLLVNPTSDSLKVLTDEITDDAAQLEAEWIDFLLEGTNLKVILDNTLGKAVLLAFKSPTLATTLTTIAEAEIKRLLSERT